MTRSIPPVSAFTSEQREAFGSSNAADEIRDGTTSLRADGVPMPSKDPEAQLRTEPTNLDHEKRKAELDVLYLPIGGVQDLERLIDSLRAPCETTLEVVKRVVAFIAVGFSARKTDRELAAQSNRDLLDILRERWASCGDRDLLLSTILKQLGIPCRRIGFSNVPYQGAHTASEIFIDDEWRFFDATTGFYFAAMGQQTPISVSKARQLYPAIQPFRTRVQPMTQDSEAVLNVAWRPATLSPAYNSLGEIYCLPRETYISSPTHGGEVLAYDDFELAIDLDEKPVWTFGQPENAEAISTPLRIGGFTKLVTMLERLGMYYGGNTRHNFHLITKEHLRLQLTVVLRDDQSAEYLDVSVLHMVTPEYLTPPFGEAKLVAKYSGSASNVVVFDIHALPPLTKVTMSVPWSHELEVRFIGFQAFPGGRNLRQQLSSYGAV